MIGQNLQLKWRCSVLHDSVSSSLHLLNDKAEGNKVQRYDHITQTAMISGLAPNAYKMPVSSIERNVAMALSK